MTLVQKEVKKVWKGNKLVRPTPTYSYDFKNDGQQSRTAYTLYGTPTFVSGEGWTIGSSSSSAYQASIVPPSSIYTGTLNMVKISFYKGVATGTHLGVGSGLHAKTGGNGIMFSFEGYPPDVIGTGWGNYVLPTSITGEIEFLIDIENKMAYINGTGYSLPYLDSSFFRNLWTNGTLGITLGRWYANNGTLYIRKVEYRIS